MSEGNSTPEEALAPSQQIKPEEKVPQLLNTNDYELPVKATTQPTALPQIPVPTPQAFEARPIQGGSGLPTQVSEQPLTQDRSLNRRQFLKLGAAAAAGFAVGGANAATNGGVMELLMSPIRAVGRLFSHPKTSGEPATAGASIVREPVAGVVPEESLKTSSGNPDQDLATRQEEHDRSGGKVYNQPNPLSPSGKY